MKSRFTQLPVRLLLVGWLSVLSANLFASTLINGLYYDLDSQRRTATLTGYTSGLTNVKVPGQVSDGGITYNVVTFASTAFTNCATLTTLSIPATVDSIAYGSFDGCTALKNLTFEDGDASLSMGYHINMEYSKAFNKYYYYVGFPIFHDCPLEKLYLGRFLYLDDSKDYPSPFNHGPYYLGYSPFYNQQTLTDVTVGEKVTKLQDYLFYNLSGISVMNLPHVKTIGNHVFEGCTKLTTLSLGDALERVGDYGFSGCTNLTNLAFPATLKVLESSAFYNCYSITSTSFADGCQLDTIGNSCFCGDVALTAFKCPKSVSYIGDGAFAECRKLVTIILGEKITEINASTFKGDIALSEMTVPEGVDYIGDQAFSGCTGMAVYSLPSTLTTIGNEVFWNNSGMTRLTIPTNVAKMGKNCFYGCTKLYYLTFEDGCRLEIDNQETYAATGHTYKDNSGIEYYGYGRNDYFYDCPLRRLYIGKDLNYYYNDAAKIYDNQYSYHTSYSSPFARKETIKKVTFGKKVTLLNDYLFAGCNNIAEIVLPDSLESIKSYAFKDCSGLKTTLFPSSTNKSINVGTMSFEKCSSMTTVTFPRTYNQISISDSVFYKCTSLTDVIFPDTLVTARGNKLTLNDGVFKYCTRLTHIAFPGTLGYIGDNAFNGCTALKHVKFMDGYFMTVGTKIVKKRESGFINQYWETYDVNYVYPLFADCPLQSLYIGKNIDYHYIEKGVHHSVYCPCIAPFGNQSTIYSVTFSQSGTVTYLNNHLLYGCSSVPALRLPESLTWIGDSTLANMSLLPSIVVPNKVRSIGNYCFANDTVLASAKLSDNITEMNEGLFDHCVRLDNLVIPEKVTTLYDKVFYACRSLSAITIPTATTKITNDVFNGCVSLANVKLNDGTKNLELGMNNPKWSKEIAGNKRGMFRDCPVRQLYLGRLVTYDTSGDQVSPFAHITAMKQLTVGPNVGIIGKYAFTGCSSLPKVYLSDNITSVGLAAFRDCSALDTLRLSDRLVSVGEESFKNCTTLKEVTLPASLDALSDQTFFGCTSLVNVDLGKTLNTIGPGAFSGCTSLRTIDIPESVYGFGVGSFSNCTTLDHITLPKGIKSIGSKSFQNDTALQWVSLSEKATSIGDQAFDGCTGLKYIKSYNSMPPEGLAGFPETVQNNATVFAPEEAIEDYQLSPTWENFKNFHAISEDVLLTSVTLDNREIHLKAGDQQTLMATVAPDNAVNKNVDWQSSDETVAKVSAEGTITALKVGQATVKAIANDGGAASDVCKVIVDSTLISSITMGQTDVSLRKYHSLQLNAAIAPLDATDTTVVWTTSDPGIVMVSTNGELTGLTPGTATVTVQAKDGGKAKATCNVTVLPVLKGDSNDDDLVNIVDAVNTVNHILNRATAVFAEEAADANNDGSISVSDVTATADIALKQAAPTKASMAKAFGMEAHDDGLLLTAEDNTLSATLNNGEQYTALQADIRVPEGKADCEVELSQVLAATHVLKYAKVDARTLRVVIYSLGNNSLIANAPLFTLRFKNGASLSGVNVDNVIASDAQAKTYHLSGSVSGTTDISNIGTDAEGLETINGGMLIKGMAGSEISIYTVNGILVKAFTATSATEKVNLSNGVYLVKVNGKTIKVTVKQ